MSEQPEATSTTAIDRWEDEASEDEFLMVEMFDQLQAKSWGNSYVAVVRTALHFGMPQYIIWDAIRHRDEVVHSDIV